ncbi:MAG: hypothetical protein ACFN3D_02370, partial [Lancefieldella parvula]
PLYAEAAQITLTISFFGVLFSLIVGLISAQAESYGFSHVRCIVSYCYLWPYANTFARELWCKKLESQRYYS